jgi:histidinol dehydrogenase
MAGPSHVLPTSGSARFYSPMGVDSFLKRMSVIEYTGEALSREAEDIIALARSEAFTAPANSIEVRL